MAHVDLEKGEAKVAQEGGDNEEDDLIKLLEQFSDRLGAVEKEVLEPAGRNRRRRNVDDKGPSTTVQVSDELQNLPEEVHPHRKGRSVRRSKPRALRLAQLLFLLLVLALAYVYWNKISQRLPSIRWPLRGEGRKSVSWFERLHGREVEHSGDNLAESGTASLKAGALNAKQSLAATIGRRLLGVTDFRQQKISTVWQNSPHGKSAPDPTTLYDILVK